MRNIRNFSIIAHIDHGKSTLADRMLEITSTIEHRKMRAQVLDSMDLERERGITIKMQPVRMIYKIDHSKISNPKSQIPNKSQISNLENLDGLGFSDSEFILNLIDTPGHIDFSYEVSRSLKAVEGVVLLVDATQGVQAQTLSVLDMARAENLVIIPVVNKIDLPVARIEEVKAEIINLIDCSILDILSVSGKTGEGVNRLLETIVAKIPSPVSKYANQAGKRALVFDFAYSTHKGVVVFIRVLDGSFTKTDRLIFQGSQEKFSVLELGVFSPEMKPTDILSAGEIGYLVTGIKKPGEAKVGDTITDINHPLPAVSGYFSPPAVVWASVYPASQDNFNLLRQALLQLKLSDASISFEEESQGVLGRGFRCGFLGMLHLEIITERLRREFNLSLVIATPTISYDVVDEKTGRQESIYSPHLFPEELRGQKVYEQWVRVKIITPAQYLNQLIPLFYDHEATIEQTENFGDDRTILLLSMPLRELMRNFFDEIKSVTSGFASLSYNFIDKREADVTRLDLLVGEEVVPAFSKVISRRRVEKEAEESVDRLKALLPRQLIIIKIQAKALGRIISSRTIAALRKDVTGYLYGGDITRKMKLLEKQKKGKKKMQGRGKVNIPPEVFLKMIKSENR